MTPPTTDPRILITGGAGFIGTHLAERLADANDVVLFDNFRRDSLSLAPGLRDHPRVTTIAGDVLDPEAIAGAMTGIRFVVHLAAIAGVSSYYKEPLKTLRVNIIGTLNVLEQAARAAVESFVYFSTSEVYGPDAAGVTEDSLFRIGPVSDRRWVYATSKLASEQLVLRYGEEHRFRAAIVRPFNVYGPRQTGEGAISNFCAAVADGRALRVYGDGSAVRAWCYVDDLVDGVVTILRAPTTAGQAFNLGNPDEPETAVGLARRLARLAPAARIEFEPVDRAEVRVRVPNIDKARAMLGFTPRVGLDEGLERTLRWFLARRLSCV
ncbi:MAG: NAD-dependent epimerase/dehydratase family protein [Acidobacteria bacterium]|nr:NAD-dependent epimerase/dehydratase family protein [Acidobacteriota bacterium]